MHNAELSDVEEDEDQVASTASAQGKDTVDSKLHTPAMGTKASAGRHGPSSTMNRSNNSPESSSASEPQQNALPKIRKHRDEGKECSRPSRGSHGSSFARPSKSCTETGQDEAEDISSKGGRDEDDQHDRDAGKVKQERNGRSSPSDRSSAECSSDLNFSAATKKKVHWSKGNQQKGDQQQTNQEDKDSQKTDQQTSTSESSLPESNLNPSRGRQPNKSKHSTAPQGRRHCDPARVSTGSPNEEDFATLDDNLTQTMDKSTGFGDVSSQSFEMSEHVSGTGHSEDKNGGTTCSPPDKTPEKKSKSNSTPSEVPNADSTTAPEPFDMRSAAGHPQSSEDHSTHGYWDPYSNMPGYNPYRAAPYGPGHRPYNHYTASEPFPGSSYPYGFNNHNRAYTSHHQYGLHHDYFAGYDNIHNNDAHDFPGAPTTTDFEFDFSGFDQPTSCDMNGADAKDGGSVPEKKKFTRLNKNKTKSAPSLSSVVGTWEMYDDGDDGHGHVDAEHNKSADF